MRVLWALPLWSARKLVDWFPFGHAIIRTLTVMVLLVSVYTFWPDDKDIPYLPGVSCTEPVGGVVGIAHNAGTAIRNAHTMEKTGKEIAETVVGGAMEIGGATRQFVEAMKGAAAPTAPIEPKQEAPQLAANCGPCPSDLTPVQTNENAKGIMLAANAALSTPWNREQAIMAVRIAETESGFDPRAENSGSTAKGMWQTMMSIHGVNGTEPTYVPGQKWWDAFDNADVSYQLWQDSGWSPWAVYNDGNLGSEAAATRAVDKVLDSQSQETRVTLAAIENGAGGKGCDKGSTMPVGDVGDRVWPVPGSTVEQTAYNLGHGGVDINRGSGSDDLGDPIVAAEGGVVGCAGHEEECYGFSGKTVTVKTASGEENLYTHLMELPLVEEGDQVVTGQLLGYVGSTGNSSAPHLHFESDVHTPGLSHQDSIDWLPDPSTFPGVPGTAA